MWQDYPRLNAVGRWLAGGMGVPFLDVADLSAMRPDDMDKERLRYALV